MIRRTACVALLLAGVVCAQTTWPTTPDTNSTLLLDKNLFGTFITSPISSSATTIPVQSTAGLAANMEVLIDFEAVKITSISSLVLTVQRGFDNTVPAAHGHNSLVYRTPGAAYHNFLASAIFAMQITPFNVLSSVPSGICSPNNKIGWVPGGSIYGCISGFWAAIVGGGGGGAAWGSISGTLSNQSDLQSALNGKQATGNYARTDSANTYGAFSQIFLSATHLFIPVSFAAAPTIDGDIAADSGSHTYQFGSNGTTQAMAYFVGSPPVTGNCLQFGSNYRLVDAGAPCGSGGGSPLTTKGDLFGFASVNARIPVGTNGQVLTADSTQALGLKWATPTGVTANHIVSGPLSALPGTCASGDVYWATDQARGLQFYQCGAANFWIPPGPGPSGALAVDPTSGQTDITSLVPLKAAANTIAGLWSFTPGADMTEQSSGATPATGKLLIYANNDGTFHQVNPSGADSPLGGTTPHWVRAKSSVTQTIPGSFSATNIMYDTNNPSTTNPALHSTVTNTQNFVPDATGIWAGNCEVSTTTSTVDMQIVVFVNGTAIANEGAPVLPSGTGGWERNLPWSYPLTSGDIVKCQAVSSSGFTASAGEGTQFFMYMVH